MKQKRLLLLLALLIVAATGAWGMQIYISYPAWPTGTTSVNSAGNLVLEMELSDSFENLKSKIQDKSELNPSYMHLYYNGSECANTEILAQKGITEGSVLTLVYIPPYAVKLKDGTADAGNWTATVGTSTTAKPLPVGGLNPKDAVTLKYGGRLKVKAVTATHDGWNGDLSNIPASLIQDDGTVIVPDGITLTGTLNVSTTPYKVVIPDGATVKLDGVSINGVNNMNYMWAGITCLGDATIILSGTNTVKGFFKDYPGIQAAAGKTLIINGTGSLTASSYGLGAGIGGKRDVACGDIEIQGGTITATSGSRGAGIGGGDNASCGNITISGGTVTATGGVRGAGIGGGRRGKDNGSCGNILISGGTVTATGGDGAAGIGGGSHSNSDKLSSCGTITITTGVTKVTATKGENAPYSIGAGKDGTCGTIIIGCTLDNNGNPEGGTKYWEDNAAVDTDAEDYLRQATIIYPEP